LSVNGTNHLYVSTHVG